MIGVRKKNRRELRDRRLLEDPEMAGGTDREGLSLKDKERDMPLLSGANRGLPLLILVF